MLFVRRYFNLDKLGTNITTEIFAGISTYLSLSYIFIVNPAILGKAGMSAAAVLFATAVASGLTTILMGAWAKLPFAVAPGLEMNGFFALVAVTALKLSWQQALGATLLSGVVCVLLVSMPFFHRAISALPTGLKGNIGVSVGVFVATTGLYLAKIISFNKNSGVPDFSNWHIDLLSSKYAIVMYVGAATAAILSLKILRFRASLFMAIIVGAVVCKVFGISTQTTAQISKEMLVSIGQLDVYHPILQPNFWKVTTVLIIITFFGAVGKSIGLTENTKIRSGPTLENIDRAVLVNGIGSTLGAFLGTSSLIIYVESAVGIASGGRTGITAIVVGFLMLASLLFTPYVGVVPVEATAGILLYVGYLLLPIAQMKQKDGFFQVFDLFIGALMGCLSFVTFGLDKAMLVGFWAYALKNIISKKQKNDYVLLIFAIMLLVSFIFQYIS